MKREHEESSGGPPLNGKFKMIEEETDGGVDELLAALGYKVRSSDMADVAQKLEQLDMVMGTSSAAQDDAIITHLASDTVHYNPADLSTWLESLISEVNAPPPLPYSNPIVNNTSSSSHVNPFDFQYYTNNESSSMLASSDLRSDLTAVTAGSGRNQKRQRKTMTSSSSSSSSSSGVHPPPAPPQPPSEASSSLPLVVVDSQEAGIRLVHTLMACAEAVQQENFSVADILVKQISVLAASQGGAMRKVANYFADALSRRIYKLNPRQDLSLQSSFSDILHMHFYESCPYLKFAHFTANQAILEAFEGCKRVHVIDFGMKQGMQWPALLQALAARPGGPPSFRLTGIGPPQPDNTDALQQVGWKLAQLADSIHVDFEYRGFVASSLSDLEAYMFKDSNNEMEPEAVAVNSVFELHKLLSRQGAILKVLNTVKAIGPKIVTVVEQEADHNSDPFSVRFTEALHYYSTMFDSLEGGYGSGETEDQVMSEVYLGKQICNIVACEGLERIERHEKLVQWKRRLGRAGFESVCLGSNAFKQASMLLSLFSGGEGYKVEEKEGCLTLGWHSRPLIATSAWRVAGDR